VAEQLFFVTGRSPKLLGLELRAYNELADAFGISSRQSADFEMFELNDAVDVLTGDFRIEIVEAERLVNALLSSGSIRPDRGVSLRRESSSRSRISSGGTFQSPTQLEESKDIRGMEIDIQRLGVN